MNKRPIKAGDYVRGGEEPRPVIGKVLRVETSRPVSRSGAVLPEVEHIYVQWLVPGDPLMEE